jgi:hypothetical protein
MGTPIGLSQSLAGLSLPHLDKDRHHSFRQDVAIREAILPLSLIPTGRKFKLEPLKQGAGHHAQLLERKILSRAIHGACELRSQGRVVEAITSNGAYHS